MADPVPTAATALQHVLQRNAITFPDSDDATMMALDAIDDNTRTQISVYHPQTRLHAFSSIKTYDSEVLGDDAAIAKMRYYRMTGGSIMRANKDIGVKTLQFLDQASTRQVVCDIPIELALRRTIDDSAVAWNSSNGPQGQCALSHCALMFLASLIIDQTHGWACPQIHRGLSLVAKYRVESPVSWRTANERAVTRVAQTEFPGNNRFHMDYFRKLGAMLINEYLISNHGVSIHATLLPGNPAVNPCASANMTNHVDLHFWWIQIPAK